MLPRKSIYIRRARAKWLRELKRRRKVRALRKRQPNKKFDHSSNTARRKKIIRFFTTTYPEQLCLRKNLKEINEIFREAREQIFQKRIKVWYVDHSKIKKATAECILYLISELFNIVSQASWLKVFAKGRPDDVNTMDLLYGSGYIDYFSSDRELKEEKLRRSLLYKDRIYIKHQKGDEVDSEFVAKFVTEFSDVLNYGDPRKEKLKIALGECIMNAVGHAYSHDGIDLLPGVPKLWWVMGYTEKEAKKAYFVILDRGVGMSETINENKLRDWFGDQLHFLPFLSKSQLINKAFDRPYSSTKQDGRGFGLPTLRRYAEISASGELYVRSHQSELRFGKKIHECNDLSIKLDGTMLVWEVDSATI